MHFVYFIERECFEGVSCVFNFQNTRMFTVFIKNTINGVAFYYGNLGISGILRCFAILIK